MSAYIDYSIGPVQIFVAQSRRTRDLWGSSYLLSVLAGYAMLGAIRAGGQIVRPKVDQDPLFMCISGRRHGSAPAVGSLPNRFQVKVSNEASAGEVAAAATQSLVEAWSKVQHAVRLRFVENAVPYGKDTEQIWNRQVSSFWETHWTVSPRDDSPALARRKLWRTHWLPDEPGDKCMVMHDLQEISGYCRASGAHEAGAQDEFWNRVRANIGSFDLREDERLCAIALVKRMFPVVVREALGWEIDTTRWPSTVYIAAVRWIRDVLAKNPSSAERYAKSVHHSVGSSAFTEQSTSFPDIDTGACAGFATLEPNYFHSSFILNSREVALADRQRRELIRELRSLHQAKLDSNTSVGPAPSYYALLLADGDSVGTLVRKYTGDVVAERLAVFASEVPGTVKRHDGVTIYSGGDDVLAMLPVETALKCAEELAEKYREAFSDIPNATLSVSLVFAQIRVPLTAVIEEAHRLLDKDAKESNGRNSLAVAVRNRGGFTCKWVTTWTRKLAGTDTESSSVDLVHGMAKKLSGSSLTSGASTSLVYRLRELISMLAGKSAWSPGDRITLLEELDGVRFIKAEVIRALADDQQDSVDSEELTDLVWNLLQAAPNRKLDSDKPRLARVTIDGLLLARFLATGGREEDR